MQWPENCFFSLLVCIPHCASNIFVMISAIVYESGLRLTIDNWEINAFLMDFSYILFSFNHEKSVGIGQKDPYQMLWSERVFFFSLSL